MKKIVAGFNDPITDFKGEPVRVTNEIDACPKCGHTRPHEAELWRNADVFLHVIGQRKPKVDTAGIKEDYALHAMGREIYKAIKEKKDWVLDSVDLDILKAELNAFSGLPLYIVVPARLCLEGAENFTDLAVVG